MKIQLLDLFSRTTSFDNFISIKNEIIIDTLKKFSSQFTHINGNKLGGKTHLLKAWAALAAEKGESSIYLNAADLRDNITQKLHHHLHDIPAFIAIDNIENLTSSQQIQLFDLFNLIKLNNSKQFLLTSSTQSLDNLPNLRLDLQTRLMSGLSLTIKHLDDSDLLHALNSHIILEGICISETELKYLINHYTRNIGVLIPIIHQIVQVAIAEKRNISIPLIKRIFLDGS